MIVLYSINWGETVVRVLSISLIVLVLIILYRKLLGRLSRGKLNQKEYCVLHSLERDPVSDEIEIYFTSETPKFVKIAILREDFSEVAIAAEREFDSGGNIVRYDTTNLVSGIYYYCLVTDNQKTMKKMTVLHPDMTT